LPASRVAGTVRRVTRFGVGIALGGAALAGYIALVGVDDVARRVTAVPPWVLVAVVGLVVAEHLVDAVGVWASVEPLRPLSAGESVQFALAGDFFDTLGPAGPVSSEPIVARFVAVATGTTYGEALGVRSAAKYLKAGTQLLLSTGIAAVLLFGGSTPRSVVVLLGTGVVALVVAGATVARFHPLVSRAVVPVLTPVVARVSALYRETPHDRAAVASAVDRFWTRLFAFRRRPRLVALIAAGGVLEQLVTATAVWVAMAGVDAPVFLLPVVAVVPLPQAASVVPIPASLGTYDLLLGGSIVLVTGAPAAAAAGAVLLVRTVSVPVSVTGGGVAVALLRGWRPGAT